MEITKQKSFVTWTVSTIAAGIAGAVVFWLSVFIGLAVASGIGTLVLWPFSEIIAGMSVDAMKGQVVTVTLIGGALYLASGCYKDYGLLGAIGGLFILLLIALSVDFEPYFTGMKRWIAENCSTFPWFGIAMAIVMGVWLLSWYYGSWFSGVVFDCVRSKFGVTEKACRFYETTDKRKMIFRLTGLWSAVALVLMLLYTTITVWLDPAAQQRVIEAKKEAVALQEAREFQEQFVKSTAPVHIFEPAPTIGNKGNSSKDKDDEVSNLFTPQSSKLDGQQQ